MESEEVKPSLMEEAGVPPAHVFSPPEDDVYKSVFVESKFSKLQCPNLVASHGL